MKVDKKNQLTLVLILIFAMVFAIIYGAANSDTPYIISGKQVTIPDYNSKVTSLDSLTRSSYRLAGWDTHWYYHIGQNGYRTTWPPTAQNPDLSNVAFFPGYPYLVKAFSYISNIDYAVSFPIFAQLCYVLLFFSLLIFYRKTLNDDVFSYAPLLLLISAPGSFFYACGYSESLFSLLLVTFLISTIRYHEKEESKYFGIALFSGFLLSATRLTGLPVAIFPVILTVLSGSKKKSKMITIAIFAASGAISFLIYCAIEFSHWNTYFVTSSVGWGRKISYIEPFMPWEMINSIRYTQQPVTATNNWIGLVLYIFFVYETLRNLILFKNRKNISVSFSVFLIGLGLFYMTLSTTLPHDNGGLIRYSLPVIALLTVYWPLAEKTLHPIEKKIFLCVLLPILYICLQDQISEIISFTSGYLVS